MGTQDTSWNSMKNFLSKRGVKEDIRCADLNLLFYELISKVGVLPDRLMHLELMLTIGKLWSV